MDTLMWLENKALDNFCKSPFWNTTLTWESDDPDFTKCFEKTILVWIPCIFIGVFSPIEVYLQRTSKNKDIPWNWKNRGKLLINALICLISLMDFAINANRDTIVKVDIFMPVCKLFSFGIAFLLAYRNKIFGVQSSGILFLFWLLCGICGIPQFRTEIRSVQLNGPSENYYDYYEYIIYLIYYPMIIAMFLLNCFGEGRPRIYPYSKSLKPNPEPESSFLSRITFSYFNPIMYKGWRHPLEMEDMWDLKPEDTANTLLPGFERKFAKNVEKRKRKHDERKSFVKSKPRNVDDTKVKKLTDTSVMPILWSTLWPEFILGVFLRLICDLSQFISPKMLGLLINFAGSNQPIWKGLLYAFIMFLVGTIVSLINSQVNTRFFIVGQRVKTIITSAIYRKALRISNTARKEKTVGEIINLMASDAQKFVYFMMMVNMVWSGPFSMILSVYFLWQELGPSVLAGVAIMMLLIPINTVIVNKSRRLQVAQMKDKDERVKIMNEILSGMKVLKLYAWEESFEKLVMQIRKKEITTLRKSSYLSSFSQFIWTCVPFLVSCLTFATYVLVDENNVLTAEKAFVSLSLMNLLSLPMTTLPMVITQLVQTWVSVTRINSFLNAEELDHYVTHDKSAAEPVLIKNGTFTWGEEPILKNINIKVAKNNLTAVVGAVGSGKSSLISAILGEMDKLSGTVNTWGFIAYVPQQAWIQNATVENNITFGKKFDKNRYSRVIDACALKSDFEMLANGDQTEIGEKGINLSGGQKQRVSLARAVYADADVYLLDDPLSAVDSHVGKHIFDNLIGPEGLLKDKTRILVTHAVTYLPQTHQIIVLKDGEMTETGSYKELLTKKGVFAEFLMQHITEEIKDEDELNELEQQFEDTPIATEVKRTISRQRSQISEVDSLESQHNHDLAQTESRDSFISKNSLIRRKSSVLLRKTSQASLKETKDGQLGKKKPEKGKLTEDESVETGNVRWEVYWYYLKAVGMFFLLGTIFFCIISQALDIGNNFWLGRWSEDPNMIVDGKVDKGLRDIYLGVYGVLGVLQTFAVFLSNIIFVKGTMKAATTLHNVVLKNVMRLPMSFFDTTPSGRILSRFSSDIINIDLMLPSSAYHFFSMSIRVIGTILVVCFATPLFTFVIIPIMILYIFIQRYYVATSRQLRRIESVSRSPIYSHFGETLLGTHVIRAFGQVDRFTKESEKRIDNNQQTVYPSNSANRWLGIRLEVIGNLIIFFAALFAVLKTDLNPAIVGLSVSYTLSITLTLNWLVYVTSEVETTIVAVERIKEYGEFTQEAAWKNPNKKPADTWPDRGAIEFKKYAVRYREGLDLVLKGINFYVNGGQKVGIVGRTGAGKSSLTLALFRIIESAEGEIKIDGKKISDLGLHDLRSHLTIIPQDCVLFSGTLRLNLDPFDKYSDEELWKALELAHLKDFVKGLPAGLNNNVSEGGGNFSVGQRQLICLARALLRKTKILILDEATAAVDLETDDLIQKTIHTAFSDCTVLTIAHRLNTIITSDRVLVMDKGQVAEFDSPNSLLQKKDSIFFGMCKDAGLA